MTTLALDQRRIVPPAAPVRAPALVRRHSESSLSTLHAQHAQGLSMPHLLGTLPGVSPAHTVVSARAPAPAAPGGNDLSLTQKVGVFSSLLKTSGEYRRVLIPAWVHTFGNGVLNGCFVGLFGRLGGFTPAQSFMAYALVESGQMLMFSVLNIYGAHKRDQSRVVDGDTVRTQRASAQRDMLGMCAVDAVISGALIGVTMSLGGARFAILPALLGVRLLMTCKYTYEGNLFTCLRQLSPDADAVTRARNAGQAFLGIEGMFGMITYNAAALAVQYLFLTSAASMFAPLTVGAVLVGAVITGAPKLYVAMRDYGDTQTAQPTEK